MENQLFNIGQKVICVDDRIGYRINNFEITPVKNTIYTVREIDERSEGIRLVEIVNEPAQYKQGYLEVYFNTKRFVHYETIIQSQKWAEELLNKISTKQEEELILLSSTGNVLTPCNS